MAYMADENRLLFPWNEDDFEMVNGNNGKFLTNLPYDSMIREEDNVTFCHDC